MRLCLLPQPRHARPCAGHPRERHASVQDVDGRVKPGHDVSGGNASRVHLRMTHTGRPLPLAPGEIGLRLVAALHRILEILERNARLLRGEEGEEKIAHAFGEETRVAHAAMGRTAVGLCPVAARIAAKSPEAADIRGDAETRVLPLSLSLLLWLALMSFLSFRAPGAASCCRRARGSARVRGRSTR